MSEHRNLSVFTSTAGCLPWQRLCCLASAPPHSAPEAEREREAGKEEDASEHWGGKFSKSLKLPFELQ